MAFDLAELGITQDDLQERVIERICEQIMTETDLGEDGDAYSYRSKLSNQLKEIVKKRIDEKVAEIAEKHVIPYTDQLVENMDFQTTNHYGEPKGERVTFKEFLAKRAENYITEEVNYEGKSKKQADSYNWTKAQTRITHMIHQHFHYHIEKEIKAALTNANDQIVEGIQKAVETKLQEVKAQLNAGRK